MNKTRTTIWIEEELIEQVKRYAFEQKKSMSQVTVEALKRFLQEEEAK